MKMLSFLASLILTASAFAQTTAPANPTTEIGGKIILNCAVAVQSGTPTVTVDVGLVNDPNADFLVLQITDHTSTFQMFAQGAKGSVTAGVTSGQYFSLMLDETAGQDAGGVVHNAGVLLLGKDATGNLSGLLSAHSAVYPLSCKPAK